MPGNWAENLFHRHGKSFYAPDAPLARHEPRRQIRLEVFLLVLRRRFPEGDAPLEGWHAQKEKTSTKKPTVRLNISNTSYTML